MGALTAAFVLAILHAQVAAPTARDGGVDAPSPGAPAGVDGGAALGASADGGAPAVKPPVLTHFVAAAYPPDAEAAGITGAVTMSIVIDDKGAVGEVKVIDPGPHPGFAP